MNRLVNVNRLINEILDVIQNIKSNFYNIIYYILDILVYFD